MRTNAQTKLTNTVTNAVIVLSDSLYPEGEHDWSPVVSSTKYALDGTMIVEQSVRQAGKPYVMQAPDGHGVLSRATVNALKAERDKLGSNFWLDYLADGAVKRVKVMFDTTGEAINATPIKGSTSPKLTDYYNVTLRFLEIPSV
ncbi:hypothetical protein Psyc_1017 [Psychrobacter arcticus 273-4]|uniref:Uncharacterized protein n=1 Tax=Psychrobacter arcticus (strain DSM 17307 / VKM B-2377 / 273-4) TaxID=259536 RepID=Q4FSY8_PSYA2|nr:hypothetical protein [Psychrobacter arcticus]AAZ18870.1 hypothetical protein Psyc_1017 [Psychrobacter arcticus 273-4]